ncbi:MAG: hypothetical protein RR162_00440 [Oscillospiraceae bacterium]
MDRSKLTQYDTPFQKIIVEKYADDIPDNDEDNADYEKIQDFLFIMGAGEQYEVENDLIKFLEKNQSSTIKGIVAYFHSIVPDGLPPCAVDWEDDDDDD